MENKVSREELIKERITAEESLELIQLSGIRMKTWEFLIKERGFSREDIIVDPEFELPLSDCSIKISIDFIIKAGGREAVLIRCAPTSIESWERYVLAFARVIKEHQIPFAAVTDGERLRLLDVPSGRLRGERLEDLPSKEELLKYMKDLVPIPFPEEKLEREKRIVYAFEGVKCEIKKND
ncbi:MAG: type I restriction enzyme HsdR N-terminal domain-containing protein [Thermodesulfovibrionales bacterium]|nr:type I restriction enzyme HsdR N-terminal domain-containing protein [Thermodesulfovibrionales bacterium]